MPPLSLARLISPQSLTRRIQRFPTLNRLDHSRAMSTESTYRPIKLSDGNEAPGIAFGIGTAWFGSECVDVVKTALAAGFKHLDLAQAYKNSASVGKALKETRTDRETLYSAYAASPSVDRLLQVDKSSLQTRPT